MGIFSSIKNAIFGGDAKAEEAPAAAPAAPAAEEKKEGGLLGQVMGTFDVMASLEAMPGADKLNWKSSIVDLMKLVGIDSSYANRKELAQELGNADYSGSAEDNVLLHQQVMRELVKNGGKVPADMLD
ncbi:MAG: DUF3597 domain-containing protein [Sphingomonadaceae bacterium]|nr:DUF3597 domain-containing protein [Sphingomonadaceae bacterium]